jgi:hypothetical protein
MEYTPLMIIVVGILVLFKWERDKYCARRSSHGAYQEGLKTGFEEARQHWRIETEGIIQKGLAEILERHELVIKVVENKTPAPASPAPYWSDAVEIPALRFMIVVEPRVKYFPRIGQLKATFEKFLG